MSNFKTLKGLYIKHVSSDPSNLIEGQIWYNTTTQTIKVAPQISAWASGGNLNDARGELAGSGILTAGLVAGGPVPSTISQNTEEYNGSSWTEGEDMTVPRGCMGNMAGTQTASFIVGGRPSGSPPTPFGSKATEEYDGTNWTNGGAIGSPTDFRNTNSFGTLTAGVMAGGDTSPPGPKGSAVNFEYDGSSWTAGNNNNTARYNSGVSGTATAGLLSSGYAQTSPSDPNKGFVGNVEEYNGSAWAEVTNVNTTRGNGAQSGPQTSAGLYGGNTGSLTANTELYDGSTWTETSNMAAARKDFAGSTNVTSNIGMWGAGGYTSTFVASTEEFTIATTAKSVDTT